MKQIKEVLKNGITENVIVESNKNEQDFLKPLNKRKTILKS